MSRSHKESDLNYIAYAQWPDEQTWQNAGNKMPVSSKLIGNNMRNSCAKIEVIHKLDVIDDILKNKTYG